MLRFWSIREQASPLDRLLRPSFFVLQFSEVHPDECRSDGDGDDKGEQGIHGLEKSHHEDHADVNESQQRERITEWLMHHMPQMKYLA